jgi:hypothetical protein
MKTDFKTLLSKLSENDFDFILIGGFAASVYGSSYVTHDLDVCAVLTPGNIWTLKDIIERLPSEDSKNEIESFNYRAKELATDVVLVTYISKRIFDKASTECLRSSVWRNGLLGWQMEFHQGTLKSNNQF